MSKTIKFKPSVNDFFCITRFIRFKTDVSYALFLKHATRL